MVLICARCRRPMGEWVPEGTVCADCTEAALADRRARRAALAVAVTCPGCGEPLLRRAPHQVACSDGCRQRLHRARVRASA